MTTYYLNGNAINEGSDITLNGLTYPYSWLEGTTPAVRASLGIEATGDINYDTRYYWGVDNPKSLEDVEENDYEGNPLFVKVYDPEAGESGEMVDTETRLVTKGLKTTCTAEIKATTNNLLKPTDYYIIRGEVEGLEMPQLVMDERAAIIAESDRVTTAIAAVTTVEELIAVMESISWAIPEEEIDPNAGLIPA
jgi:hypothetical protein